MKKYYISRNLDLILLAISLIIVLFIGFLILLAFLQKKLNFLYILIMSIIFVIVSIVLFIFIIKDCFHYIYFENDYIVYKTVFTKKRIYLYGKNIEYSKKNVTMSFITRFYNEDVIIIKLNSIEIKIPMHTYKEIKKDYSQLPDV